MEVGEPKLARIFAISEKTPHSWLMQRNLQNADVRWHIAGDIVNNARELDSRIDWREVLDQVTWKGESNIIRGRLAIRDSIASSLASMAKSMGWDMHSPEVVYMSGFHPLISLTKRVDILNENLAKAEERKFMSEEKKKQVLQSEREEVGRLGMYKKRLYESLEEYARQNLPENSGYLRVLQRASYLNTNIRTKIVKLLKQRRIQDAVSIL